MTRKHYDGDSAGTRAASDISDTVCDNSLFRMVVSNQQLVAGGCAKMAAAPWISPTVNRSPLSTASVPTTVASSENRARSARRTASLGHTAGQLPPADETVDSADASAGLQDDVVHVPEVRLAAEDRGESV